MPGEHEAGERPRLRRFDAVGWGAELDLDAHVVTVFETEGGRVADEIGRGRWVPLPPPLDHFRGRVVFARACASPPVPACSPLRDDSGPTPVLERARCGAGRVRLRPAPRSTPSPSPGRERP